jgi:hypothetical protein
LFLPRHGGGENVIDWEDCKEVPVCEIAAKSQDRGVWIALLWGAPQGAGGNADNAASAGRPDRVSP